MAQHHSHIKTYLIVYLALMGLMVLTVWAAHIPLGVFGFPVMISIAVAKAFMIMWIFMHVKDEKPLIQAFAFVAYIWVGILFTFTFADYLTRDPLVPIERGDLRKIAIESVNSAHEHHGEGHGKSHSGH